MSGTTPTAWFYAMTASDGTVVQYGHVAASQQSAFQAAFPAAVEITQTQLNTLRAGGTYTLAGGVLSPATTATPTLAAVQAKALSAIDAQAEMQRYKILTPGSGQSLEYADTYADAQAVLATGSTNPTLHPWVAAEQAAQASNGNTLTLVQAANAITSQYTAWQNKGAAIKRVRRTAKIAVSAATTSDQVTAILQSIAWP